MGADNRDGVPGRSAWLEQRMNLFAKALRPGFVKLAGADGRPEHRA